MKPRVDAGRRVDVRRYLGGGEREHLGAFAGDLYVDRVIKAGYHGKTGRYVFDRDRDAGDRPFVYGTVGADGVKPDDEREKHGYDLCRKIEPLVFLYGVFTARGDVGIVTFAHAFSPPSFFLLWSLRVLGSVTSSA